MLTLLAHPWRARFLPRFGRTRIALPRPVLNLCVALWILALLNGPFWRALWGATGSWEASHAGFILSLPIFVLLWVWLLLELLTWGRAARPVLAGVLLASAAAAYFMSAYAVVFDRAMIASILDTDLAESLELFSPRLFGWMMVLGALPAWLLSRVELAPRAWYRHLADKIVVLGVLGGALILVVAPFFQSYAPLLRNHRELRLTLVPSNFLASALGYAKRHGPSNAIEQVALDATRIHAVTAASRPTLTILAIGETARAASFALNGYPRPTTPELAREPDLINFRQVRSCGTSTAVSLPCMFLDVGRAGFSDTLASRRENLLDVLQRSGYGVIWRDNNSGCKGLCDRVQHEDLTRMDVPEICAAGECYDDILLHGLQEKLDAIDRDTVIVLHMKGSHGPAYYRRYPAAFEYFKPACKTNELDRCPREAIVNAYDNTLRYTDHVLAQTIALLRRNAGRFDTSLIYVSDHGESIGERGLYLHGMPYALAPDEQTHVPMLMWISPGAQSRFGVDAACLRRRQDEPLSHDNLYHSTIGLLDVQTRIYRAANDVFRNCRTTTVAVAEPLDKNRLQPVSPAVANRYHRASTKHESPHGFAEREQAVAPRLVSRRDAG